MESEEVTAIFSIVDGALLKPLAYRIRDGFTRLRKSALKMAPMYPRLPVNAAHFRSWQEQCTGCESGALANPAAFNLTDNGEPERIEVCYLHLAVVSGFGRRCASGTALRGERRSAGGRTRSW